MQIKITPFITGIIVIIIIIIIIIVISYIFCLCKTGRYSINVNKINIAVCLTDLKYEFNFQNEFECNPVITSTLEQCHHFV